MERADRNVLDGAPGDEGLHLFLCVVAVGERHRRLRKAETPSRRQRGVAGEIEEFSGYIGNLGAGEDIIVEVAARRLIAPVGSVIIVVLAAEIERGGGHIVVEKPARDAGRPIAGDQERPVLIERIAAFRVESETVHHRRAQPPATEIEFAGLVAEAMEAVALRSGEGVADACLSEGGRVGHSLAREHAPVRQRPDQGERLRYDGQDNGFCRQDNAVPCSGALHFAGGPGALVEAVAAFPGRVGRAAGGDHPGSRRNRTIAAQIEDAGQIGLEEGYAADDAVVAFDPHAALGLQRLMCATQRFHDPAVVLTLRVPSRRDSRPLAARFPSHRQSACLCQ